jgi:hypothetical protein
MKLPNIPEGEFLNKNAFEQWLKILSTSDQHAVAPTLASRASLRASVLFDFTLLKHI